MNCPACGVPLQRSERQEIEIDFCPQCRGVWLDRGELDKIIELAGAEMVAMTAGGTSAVCPAYPSAEHQRDGRRGDRLQERKGLLNDLFD
jgi:uncharacterized protein